MLDDDLARRLSTLERCVRVSVAHRRAGDPNPDDPFRGMYVSDEHVDRLIAGRQVLATRLEAIEVDPTSRAGRLAARFDLDELDLGLLTVAVAPDLDDRFEQLFGYLHDDITRRRASLGLALELCGRSPADAGARIAVSRPGRLVSGGLLEIEDHERPFLTRSLRVPDRVLDHLLGNDHPDVELLDVAIPTATRSGSIASAAARALRAGVNLIHLRERFDTGATGIASAALREAGLGSAVCVEIQRAHPEEQFRMVDLARREARLIGGGLVVANFHQLPVALRRHVARGDVATFVIGADPFDPDDSHETPLSLDVTLETPEAQEASWRQALGDSSIAPPTAFRFGPKQIRRAVEAARVQAISYEQPIGNDHLVAGARQQNATGLERFARRLEPSVCWDDIVLPRVTAARLHELVNRVAHRALVYDGWGLRRGGGRGEGLVALFAGASGTGKTLAAEVIASELGLEMYVINLATVVDKYIGETEKNLERIFTEAEGVSAVLFFDEADALFGKRSEVNDARDRYANVEVAYLLQRLETFDGLGILATNLKTNLDEAFARRLSMVVDFPDPDGELRRSIWEHMTLKLPLAPDVDLAFLADQFELSGGNIRNIVVAAAFCGAAENGVVAMDHFIHATRLEYQKLGRLCLEREFGPYYHHVRGTDGTHP